MSDSAQVEITENFIEQMGLIAQGDGLPRIAGQILGLLLIETEPFSFSEIAQRLAVSRGSVSTNTRLLESLRVIERVSKLGQRSDFFQLAKDPYAKLLEGVAQRMTKSIAILKSTRKALPAENMQSANKLLELESFYSEYLESNNKLIQKLKANN